MRGGRPFHLSAPSPEESIRFQSQDTAKWNSIAIPLFQTMPETGESPQFSISLPSEAIEMIENGLIPYGLYGKKKATICRELILVMLRSAEVKANITEGRQKSAKGSGLRD